MKWILVCLILKKQCELIKPKLILCLGLTAAKGLLKKKESLGQLRKSIFEYEGAKVIVYVPSGCIVTKSSLEKRLLGRFEEIQKNVR